jgi:hypothetical protein
MPASIFAMTRVFWSDRLRYPALGLGKSTRRREFITLAGNGAGPLQQPPSHHLAQLNVGRIRYPLDDLRMADFTTNLALVNGIAERSAGFVWRYVDESGNATDTRPYADPRIIINFSVWESVEALERFVWQTVHKRFYGRRTDWFEHFEGPSVVLWWVPVGHRPGVEEAVARLEYLKKHGPGDHAFDWQTASAQLWKTARCAPAGQVA